MFLEKNFYFVFFTIVFTVLISCASQKKIISNISSNNKQIINKELTNKNHNNARALQAGKKTVNSNFIQSFIDNLKSIIEFKKKPSVPFFAMSYFQFNDIYFKNIASFHTLAVHFPFFILLLVFIFYLLFLLKKNVFYLKINFYLMLVSSFIVFLASFLLFPETKNLTKSAEAVLQKHIYFAYSAGVFNLLLTIYFALKIWSRGKIKIYLESSWVTLLVIFFLGYNLFTIGVTTFYGEILVKKFQIGL